MEPCSVFEPKKEEFPDRKEKAEFRGSWCLKVILLDVILGGYLGKDTPFLDGLPKEPL